MNPPFHPLRRCFDHFFGFLTGKQQGAPHGRLFWRFGKARAVREGDHKLLLDDAGGVFLYDLSRDPSETANLADSNPSRVRDLRAALDHWEQSMLAPRAPETDG